MMTVATRVAVEVVRFQPELDRLPIMFSAFSQTAKASSIDLVTTHSYQGGADWLLFWGPGSPLRASIMQQHVAAGGHAIALDLAYWQRDRKFRVSIDAPHPQAWVMKRNWPALRLQQDVCHRCNAWNPTGPIIVAGLGRKAKVQYGSEVDAWEADMMAACRSRWPKRNVIYRPKPTVPDPQIDQALSGASLVITWHSNVAVDAIRNGIPVVCRDGAAAAVCPSELPDEPQPLSVDLREQFLRNLAWFQWAPFEAKACWAFLRELLT